MLAAEAVGGVGFIPRPITLNEDQKTRIKTTKSDLYKVKINPQWSLNVRNKPSETGGIVKKLSNGQKVRVVCHAWDEQGRMWDRINGTPLQPTAKPQYVLDKYVFTGTNGKVAPTCREWTGAMYRKRAEARLPLVDQQRREYEAAVAHQRELDRRVDAAIATLEEIDRVERRLQELDAEKRALDTTEMAIRHEILLEAGRLRDKVKGTVQFCESTSSARKALERWPELAEKETRSEKVRKALAKYGKKFPIVNAGVESYCALADMQLRYAEQLIKEHGPDNYRRKPLKRD